MNRLILSIVVSFFCFLVAAPMPQQEPAKAQEKRKLTAEEKVLSWKGERVIFLKREGSILSSAGVVLPIYKCIGGKKFIVANGKVAQYVE